jgi:hypothetical protein
MSSHIPSSLQGSNLQHFSSPYSIKRTEYAEQLKANTRSKMDLTLMTAEGDKVTLSLKSASRTDYTRYDAQGRLHGPSDIHAESLHVRTKDKVAVAVEGDLNAAELADIEQLFDRLQEVATDFFAGDLAEALDGALAIDDLGSIASFDANLKLHQRVSVAQSRTARYEHRQHPTTAAPTTPAAVERVVDDMVQAVDDAKVALSKMGQRLSGLVSDFFENLAEQLNLNEPDRQLAAQMSSRLAQHLNLTVQGSDTPDESTATAAAVSIPTVAVMEGEVTPSGLSTDVQPNTLS